MEVQAGNLDTYLDSSLYNLQSSLYNLQSTIYNLQCFVDRARLRQTAASSGKPSVYGRTGKLRRAGNRTPKKAFGVNWRHTAFSALLFNLQSSLFNLQSSLFNLQSSLFNLQSTIFNLQCFLDRARIELATHGFSGLHHQENRMFSTGISQFFCL